MADFNFENDLRKELKEISSSLGFKITEHKNLDKMLMDYLTVRTKIIEPKQRSILINPILKEKFKLIPKEKK